MEKDNHPDHNGESPDRLGDDFMRVRVVEGDHPGLQTNATHISGTGDPSFGDSVAKGFKQSLRFWNDRAYLLTGPAFVSLAGINSGNPYLAGVSVAVSSAITCGIFLPERYENRFRDYASHNRRLITAFAIAGALATVAAVKHVHDHNKEASPPSDPERAQTQKEGKAFVAPSLEGRPR